MLVRKDAILAELEKEGLTKKLDDSKTLSLPKFIDFLFDNFPVKHRIVEKPIIVPGNEKRACIHLASLYHPDRVREMYGSKYKVLCGEITKRINARLEEYR